MRKAGGAIQGEENRKEKKAKDKTQTCTGMFWKTFPENTEQGSLQGTIGNSHGCDQLQQES